MIDQERQIKNRERFLKELEVIKDEPGYDKLIDYIVNKSDMFTAPGSTRFHMSVEGGLLQHSLNVLDALRSLLHKNDNGNYEYRICDKTIAGQSVHGKPLTEYTERNIVVIALLHDLCKTRFYSVEKRNRKVDGAWEEYDAYTVKDQVPLGHGEKSAMMIQQFGLQLQQAELYAIRWHMGFPEGADKYTFSNAVDLFPIVWATHNADMMATHFMEDNEGNKPEFV